MVPALQDIAHPVTTVLFGAVATAAGLAAIRTWAAMGVWTWVVQPDPVPKPPADHGTPAFACDRQKIENTCYSIRVGGDARAIDEQKAMCPMLQGKVVDHCPAEGVFGRCEDPSKGVTVFRYGAMFDLARKDCEKSGFSWTAP